MFHIFGQEMSVCEAMGWIGALLLIVAYFLLSAKFIKDGFAFQILNIIGAAGLLLAAAEKKNYPTVVLEVAWILIAAYAIAMILRQDKRKDCPG